MKATAITLKEAERLVRQQQISMTSLVCKWMDGKCIGVRCLNFRPNEKETLCKLWRKQ